MFQFCCVSVFKCSSVFVRSSFPFGCGGLTSVGAFHTCMNAWTPDSNDKAGIEEHLRHPPTHRFISLSRELLLIKPEVQGPWCAWAACLWPCVCSVSFYKCAQVWLRLSFSVIALTNMFALHVVVERHAVRDSAGPLGTPDRGHIKKWRKQASFVPLNTWTWCFYVHVVT